ncbi:MAG: nuclear transport factor 2 family protein [Halioglobus sp.]|nr:nuclear transport factor 2 family protein [Halioglobus sp.]
MTPDSDQPTHLADRLAMIDVLHRHCRGLDRCDAALLQACYWRDAEVDYGSYRGPAAAFCELVVKALAESYQLTRHCIGNTLVARHGGDAHCESYVDAAHLLPDGSALMQFAGRYLDTLQQRDGAWRLLHRQVVIDWCHTAAIQDERDSQAFSALARGRNDGSDPLYPFLGDAR